MIDFEIQQLNRETLRALDTLLAAAHSDEVDIVSSQFTAELYRAIFRACKFNAIFGHDAETTTDAIFTMLFLQKKE